MIEVRDGKFYRLPPEGSIPCGRDRATRLVECEFVLSFKWISSFYTTTQKARTMKIPLSIREACNNSRMDTFSCFLQSFVKMGV